MSEDSKKILETVKEDAEKMGFTNEEIENAIDYCTGLLKTQCTNV